MKYAVFFLLCCLALAAAAPQYFWPGIAAPAIATAGFAPYGRTVVAGPTVVNGFAGARYVAPGFVGTTFI